MKIKKYNKFIFFGVPILIIIIWQLLGSLGKINTAILSTPSQIVLTFIELAKSGRIWLDLGASVRRVLYGFVAGTLAGIIAGILTGMFPKFNSAVAVVFGILRPIPMIGLVPLMILWFGIGEKSKIIIIAIGTFWSILINTQEGISNVDPKLVEVARILEKDKKTLLSKVILPAAIPSVITGVRLGIGNAWKSVIAAEMLAASRGIGYMIEYARELAQPSKMLVGLLAIGLIGLLIDQVIILLQRKFVVWT